MTETATSIEVHHDIDGRIAEAVNRALGRGEIGLQISAVGEGGPMVEVSAGVTDVASAQPVTSTSLFPVFSVTKGVVAALALRLLGDGVIDLATPIATVWPEFAAGGKGEVTLEHALTHSAGIPQMPDGVTPEVMCDWERMCHLVAGLEPLWRPGTKVGYHSYTFGWIVGEVLRRALGTDATVGALVREYVTQPVGVNDFWIGTPASEHGRIVTLYKEPRPAGTGLTLAERAIPPALPTGQDVFGRRDVRESCHPAAGGITTASALATIFARLAADGGGIVAPEWIEQAACPRRDETDVVIGGQLAKGLGYYVSARTNMEQGPPFEADRRTFGHPGSGGSIAWADRDRRAGFAITRSRMTTAGWNDPVMVDLVRELRDAVGSGSSAASVSTAASGSEGQSAG